MKVKITVDRPQGMPRDDLLGDAESYEITLAPDVVDKFIAGGIITLELQEAEKSVVIRASVKAA